MTAIQFEDIPCAYQVPLSSYTTFGIGGPADILVSPQTPEQLQKVLQVAKAHDSLLYILGGGSNLLVSDEGIRGIVVRLEGELADIQLLDDNACIQVGAGASFPALTKTALDAGWPSALGWFGTPGQVGGALKMNAGTRLGEIGDVVVEVHAMTHQGPLVIPKADIGFSYRNSRFPADVVLYKAILRCEEREVTDQGALRAKAKQLYQTRQSTQPKGKSAGSIFKNPVGDYAGRLIEAAGLKGITCGGAQISQVHANFIINTGHASAQEVYQLALLARKEVYEKFHILLEFEVKFAGRFEENPGICTLNS